MQTLPLLLCSLLPLALLAVVVIHHNASTGHRFSFLALLLSLGLLSVLLIQQAMDADDPTAIFRFAAENGRTWFAGGIY